MSPFLVKRHSYESGYRKCTQDSNRDKSGFAGEIRLSFDDERISEHCECKSTRAVPARLHEVDQKFPLLVD